MTLKNYYQRHKKNLLEYQKKYNLANKEKIKEYQKIYFSKKRFIKYDKNIKTKIIKKPIILEFD
jgi:hypothetical protein